MQINFNRMESLPVRNLSEGSLPTLPLQLSIPCPPRLERIFAVSRVSPTHSDRHISMLHKPQKMQNFSREELARV